MTSKPGAEPPTREEAERHAAIDELTFTAALLYFRMRRAGEEILGEGVRSTGRRSILRSLARGEPQTVPQMARLRAVSRQHVQKLVNGLRADGLVELRHNPAHKRSRLVALTEAGARVAAANVKREARLFPELSRGLSLEEIRTATRVLRTLKAALESDRWRRLLDS